VRIGGRLRTEAYETTNETAAEAGGLTPASPARRDLATPDARASLRARAGHAESSRRRHQAASPDRITLSDREVREERAEPLWAAKALRSLGSADAHKRQFVAADFCVPRRAFRSRGVCRWPTQHRYLVGAGLTCPFVLRDVRRVAAVGLVGPSGRAPVSLFRVPRASECVCCFGRQPGRGHAVLDRATSRLRRLRSARRPLLPCYPATWRLGSVVAVESGKQDKQDTLG
jgi:hypothetical protein